MSKDFNEATRVQMPALVHLTRLGYTYYGKINENQAGIDYDPDTNILIKVFEKKFDEMNPSHKGEAKQWLQTFRQELDNDDLGHTFYNRIKSVSPVKFIDFDDITKNDFHCTAEFTCKNGDEEFRPDITLFVNGLPLAFIEVKKPNNKGGMTAEADRMNNERFPNRKFRRFINGTQLMIFSNNMEYNANGGIVPVEGAFYCTAGRKKVPFNCFREENPKNELVAPFINNFDYKEKNEEVEKKILADFNNQVLHSAPEYIKNLDANTPTNRIITSMCSPERLLYIIHYGIDYVKMEREVDGKIESTDEKHIMRYQQLFATKAITEHLQNNVYSGIIWHTQGSGKTALSFYLNSILTDFFAKKNIVAKFYFIVDRIDLLEQASQEFEARGLVVHTADSRAKLMEQFRQNQAQEGHSGKPEITVVNIQKFEEDTEKVELPNYATNLQRVFIIDEAHRGYNPKGCFLANLLDADKRSVKIALTGTPLLKDERASWKVFGNYIHTYYYDKSIQDGYTLKIIREEIETSYKEQIKKIYDIVDKKIEEKAKAALEDNGEFELKSEPEDDTKKKHLLNELVQKKDVRKQYIIEHDNYVKELLKYIITDLQKFRYDQGDETLGGMVICETSGQAKNLFNHFNEIQTELNKQLPPDEQLHLKAGLILHDIDDKETRKQTIKDFKKNMTIDILIVFNMLLTGFDAPRLKRLYFGRKLQDHNLLQAITRVNRPYKKNRYGFVVDFADIKANFDETNALYLKELGRFNNPDETGEGNAVDIAAQVLENKGALVEKMKQVKSILFNYSTENMEDFQEEVTSIEDKGKLLELRKVLEDAKDCINVVRVYGDDELKEQFAKLKPRRLPEMLSEVQRRIDLINYQEALENGSDDTKVFVNDALKDIKFTFSKIGEEELKIINDGEELQNKFREATDRMAQMYDTEDPEYIAISQAIRERCKEHGFKVDSVAQYNEENKAMNEILQQIKDLEKKNNVILNHYNGDEKFARLHKRIAEENEKRKAVHKSPILSDDNTQIMESLKIVKADIDQKIYDRNDILKKDAYFGSTVTSEVIKSCFLRLKLTPDMDACNFIQTRIVKQYMAQYNETYPAA